MAMAMVSSSFGAATRLRAGGLARMQLASCLGRRACSSLSLGCATAAHTIGMRGVDTPNYVNVPLVQEDPDVILAELPPLVLSGQSSASSGRSPSTRSSAASRFGPLAGNALKEVSAAASVASDAVADPQVRFAQMDNGVRIAALDRGGLCSSIGLFVHTGSRFESAAEACLPHVLELMAFRSSNHLSAFKTLKTLEQLGSSAVCRAGREDILYQVDFVREYMPVVLPLLLANVLCPSLVEEEVHLSQSQVPEVQQTLEENPDSLISELLHVAAYKDNTLGFPVYATEKDLHLFTPSRIKQFLEERCTPDRQILVGVNVDFDAFCKWTARSYASAAIPSFPAAPRHVQLASYTGGEVRMEKSNPLCHLMLGWEVAGGWNGPSLAAITVLQMLLGGGGSFSTGGPGKGMHTRLYTEVLNRYSWVESCQASSVMYSDSGLFTVYATVLPKNAVDFINVILKIFQGLKKISAVEMTRAKNALKSSIHMNLEMRAVVMEDIGRQLVLAGKVGTAREFGRMIDAVTPSDLVEVLRECLKATPTLVAYGAIEKAPSHSQVVDMIKKSGLV